MSKVKERSQEVEMASVKVQSGDRMPCSEDTKAQSGCKFGQHGLV